MMPNYTLAILSMMVNANILLAQNLVPNSSFEDFKELPCGLNTGFIQKFLKNWSQPLPTSTDYWNDLSPVNCYYNPQTISRSPRTGHGMAGLVTAKALRGVVTQYREYIQVELAHPLQKGHLYNGEFFVFTGNVPSENIVLSANNIGLAFSQTLILESGDIAPDHLNLTSMVLSKRIIEPTGQWEKIEGCFVADNPYKYLLIGNFGDIKFTSIAGQINQPLEAFAYYFIDDVSLVELSYDVASLRDEVEFCYNKDDVLLDSNVRGALSYLWSNGKKESSQIVSTKLDEKYAVEIAFIECTYTHTFDIKFVPDVRIGLDTVLCHAETLVLNPRHPLNEFLWWDGSNDTLKMISQTGTYWVDVPSACMVRDTISVRFVDCPGLVPNVFTPNDDQFNQTFEIENITMRNWSLTVYDRWGVRVYFSEKYGNDWDGVGLTAGIYYYILGCLAPNKKLIGWVHVIR